MQTFKTTLTLALLLGLSAHMAQAKTKGVHYPDRVGQAAWVSSPPTNIRATPNGKIQCVVQREERIRLYGSSGKGDHNGVWYYTDYCGKMGLIHSTQFVIFEYDRISGL